MIRCDVPLTEVDAIRSDLRALLRPGQRRIHFRKESPSTRSAVLRVIASYNVHTTVFISSDDEVTARSECITELARNALASRIAMLTFETDVSYRTRDSQSLQPVLKETANPIPWRHLSASNDAGLWIPDAVGWCLDHPDRRWRDAISRLSIERVWLR